MQTIEEVKSHPDFMSGLELPEFAFNVYVIYQQEALKYVTFWKGEKLFFGDDFKPEIVKDPLTTICQLLAILTVQPGAAPLETFKNYNNIQMQWAICAHCSELKALVHAFMDEGSQGHKEARTFFEMRFAN